MKHTPTPWKAIYKPGNNRWLGELIEGDKLQVATFYTKSALDKAVACVNACQGINPQALKDLLSLLKGMDLVAMCECHHGDRPKWTCPFCEIKAALVKANDS